MKAFNQLAVAACGIILANPVSAAVISYADFSSVAGLTLNGNAAVAGGNVLRVTPATTGQAGSAFSTNKVSLASNASFSTFFQFQFTNPGVSDGQGVGADGLVFVVQTVSNNVGGAGGGIGYFGINNSVGIEFDTWNNGGGDNNSSNHIGIDVNGSVSSIMLNEVTEADMNNGDIWNAWIDYDGGTQLLEARLTRSGVRPNSALLSTTLDLASVLGATDAFVGFTSGTGAAWANHDVLTWTLEDHFAPIGGGGNSVPEPGSLLLLGTGLALTRLMSKRSN